MHIYLAMMTTVALVATVNTHGVGHGSATTNLSTSGLMHDKEHVKQHYEGVAQLNENMTSEELEFHYFLLHDFDQNKQLDGLECLYAVMHMDDDHGTQEEVNESHRQMSTEEAESYRERMSGAIEIIDRAFQEDDFNNDGYLSYVELKSQIVRDHKRYEQI